MDQTPTEPTKDAGDLFSRVIVAVVVLPLLFLGMYFIGQTPYSVTSYRQLGDYSYGKRVQFVCQYEGKVRGWGHLEFEGRPILLKPDPDNEGWLPEVGASCEVVGELRHLGKTFEGIDGVVDYVIANPQLQPAKPAVSS